MIFFNLIFSSNLAESTKGLNNPFNSINQLSTSYRFIRKKFKLAYIIKKTDILSQSRENLAKEKFVQPNILDNLLSSIWQQTIFLSIPNKVSDKYILELNYLNIGKQQNYHKYLVSKFSKSLFDLSIQSSFYNDKNIKDKYSADVFYLWSKDLKVSQAYLYNLFQSSKLKNYIKNMQLFIDKKSQFNYLPIFTVSNNLGQMVISELPQEFNLVPQDTINQYVYHGWFFVNYKDAQEYIEQVSKLYGLQKSSLKIFTCNISTIYKMMNKFNNKIHFRLIPDLEEVGKLVKNYRYSKNISFYNEQTYSKKSFKGQPLYMFNEINNIKSKNINNNNFYNLAFTNYNTALDTWYKFNNNSKLFFQKKSLKPSILVYNLEDLIVKSLTNNNNSLLLVPSREVYDFTKKYHLKQNPDIVYDTLYSYISSAKLWSKRIFWSLTSRQP